MALSTKAAIAVISEAAPGLGFDLPDAAFVLSRGVRT